MTLHITPIGDSKPHGESSTCECEPKVEFENGHMIIIHMAFDGREAVEWTKEILNNKK